MKNKLLSVHKEAKRFRIYCLYKLYIQVGLQEWRFIDGLFLIGQTSSQNIEIAREKAPFFAEGVQFLFISGLRQQLIYACRKQLLSLCC